jgi:exodeoxyribonuclease VII large subunit
LWQQRSRLNNFHDRLHGLSPLNILERGYALVFDSEGQLVKDATQVPPGSDVKARLARGELTATVKSASSS